MVPPINIDDQQSEILKKLTSAERLNLSFNLYDFARQRVEAEIRHHNPGVADNEINQIVNQRFSR